MEGDRRLEGLLYEAYLPMAHKYLDRIFRELEGMYPCHCVEFVHRLGWVPVNEASLWMRVQSSHRGEAFGMLSESIRRMKIDVPIWKSI
jgi:molybdopterin synthase catalytic subunit